MPALGGAAHIPLAGQRTGRACASVWMVSYLSPILKALDGVPHQDGGEEPATILLSVPSDSVSMPVRSRLPAYSEETSPLRLALPGVRR
jgi:hypothetical protein